MSSSSADSLRTVILAVYRLHQLSDDLESLRLRVATGDADSGIPIDAHLDTLKMAIRHLSEFKRAVAEQ